MAKKMKAVLSYGPLDYRLEEVHVPRAGPGEVVIEVEACGICAGDLKCYDGAAMFWGGGVNPPYVKGPVIAGHEFVGTVVELGEGAGEKYGLRVGDKAVSEQIVPCWECRYCSSGAYWMCEVHNIYGFQREVADGGMAEYARFPSQALNYRVPESLTPQQGAMVEPLACAIHGVQRAKIELGEVVVIAGMGTIGLCMLQVAKLKSPGKMIALDAVTKRLEVARKLGADLAINVKEEDPVTVVKELTGGYGCDVYIEATGHPSGVVQGLSMIRKLGRFVEFSVFGEETTVDWSIIGDRKELDLLGAHLSPYVYPLAIDYLAEGMVKVDDIVTHTFPLSDFERAFDMAKDKKEAIKVQLLP